MEKVNLSLARLERIKTIIEGWQRHGSISGIERRIVLNQLASLYDELDADVQVVEPVENSRQPVDEPLAAAEPRPESADAPKPTPAKVKAEEKKPAAGRLGEQLNEGRKFLFENFGERDDSGSARMAAIADLGSAIGINDRFLFIKELFNGDGKLFEQAVRELNSCKNMEEAFMYIHQNFDWKDDDPTVKQLVTLVRRRFM